MKKEQIIAFIRTVPLFHSFAPEQLGELADSAEVREIAADEVIIERDTEVSELFVIVYGEFELYLRDEDMDFEHVLATLAIGDHFGEVALLTGQLLSSSVRAKTAGQAIVLHKETIESLLDRSREFRQALFRAMGQYLNQSIVSQGMIPFARLDSFDNLRSAAGLLSPRICRFCEALPVEREDDRVTVAMVNPSDVKARSFIVNVLGQYQVSFVAVSGEDFERHATMHLKDEAAPESDEALADLAYVNSSGVRTENESQRGEDLLARVLRAAVSTGASDVHIEPNGQASRVRMRIDGSMLDFEDEIAPENFRQFVSRIKVISELDITNNRRPQDGRFAIEHSDTRTDIRVSTTPCYGGEKVVLRLLGRSQRLLKLDNLILSAPAARFAQDIFENPSGLILVTGPTGSGKTTTLYAAMHGIERRDRSLNMVTIEDPIEYNLPFATQIQVNHDLDLGFANILRTVLRQDPDAIMVGEIRDHESAEIALDAATTGHLVLSSLHTSSAIGTVVRLRDLEVEPYLIAGALKGIISQRLVPRLCPGCTERVPADDPSVELLRKLGVLDDEFDGEPLRGVDTEGGPPGGESGRVAVFEMLSVGRELSDAIDRNAPASELRECLDSRWFISFARYSRFLLTQGLVAPERIARLFPKHDVIDLSAAGR